jgi:hypothetical protein
VESAINFPTFRQTRDEAASAATESTVELPPQGQPTTVAAAEVKPARKKTAERQGRPTSSNTTEAAQQTKPGRVGVKYVAQAELDREQVKLEKLSQAALAGDSSALDKLRVALDSCPHIWRRLADLQLLVEHKLIALVAGKDPLLGEAFRKRCSELRHLLLDGEPCSLATKMAASRVVATFMFAQLLELRALQSPVELRCVKQLEQAERRHQVAMRTFLMTRRSELQLSQLA